MNNPSRVSWPTFFVVLALLLVGALFRIDLLLASHFVIDADEAIVGLMAKHILETGNIPVFYYGQHYMGSLEALLASLVFALAGISSATLKSVPLLCSLLWMLCVYFIGKRLGGRPVAILALFFAACAPVALLVWSAKARGGFIELMCIGGLSALYLFSLLDKKSIRLPEIFLLGALLGFGWWVNNQIVYFFLPTAYLLLVRLRGMARTWLEFMSKALLCFVSGMLGFFAGGSPYWAYNVKHNFVSLEMFHSAEEGEGVLVHLSGLASEAFPILSGARGLWQEYDAFALSSLFMAFLYLLLLYFGWKTAGERLRKLLCFREPKNPAFVYCLLLILAALLAFSFSSFGHLTQEPRYLLPTYTAVFPLLAYGVYGAWKRLPVLAVLACAAILFVQLHSAYPGLRRNIPGEPFVYKGERVSHSHKELLEWLQAKGYSWVKTNYWIGYRLAFESNERVRFFLFQSPYQVRIPRYQQEAKRAGAVDTAPLVLVPAQARLVEQSLRIRGYEFQKERVSGYVVLYDLRPLHSNLVRIDAAQMEVSASHFSEKAIYAIDGDESTRWASHTPQKPGMEFLIRFPEPVDIAALEIDMGEWSHDFPRSLRIEVVDEFGQRKKWMNRAQYRNVQYYLEWTGSWRMYVPRQKVREIRLTQMGEHPVLDWSIAEVSCFTDE